MRHASDLREYTEGVLEEKFKEIESKVLLVVEKAANEGKFKATAHFDKNLDIQAKEYITNKLRDNGYKTVYNSYRGESSLEVSW